MKIVIIVGQICSGKDTVANRLLKEGRVNIHISIGNIVRELTENNARVHDRNLNGEIVERLSYMMLLNTAINKEDYNVVITGIRQKSILIWLEGFLHRLSALIDKKLDLELMWLDTSLSTRRKRYYKRNDTKDSNVLFEIADKKDIDLGILEVKNYVVNNTFYKSKLKIVRNDNETL